MIRVTALLGALFVSLPLQSTAGMIDGSTNIELNILGNLRGAAVQVARIDRDDVVDPETGDFAFDIPSLGTAESQVWTAENISVSGNVDPFIDLDFTITNVSSVFSANITVSAVVPISGSFPGPNVLFGRIGGTITDTGGDGEISLESIGPTPIFVGTVDSGVALPIAIADIVVSSAPGISLGFGPLTDIDPAFGPASSTIGIDLAFTLSPGDTVTIDSFFSLEPIPEPAGAASC